MSIINCKGCGVAFKVPRCRAKTAKWCSQHCRNKNLVTVSVRSDCKFCGQPLTKRRNVEFCSITCRNKGLVQRGKDCWNWKNGATKSLAENASRQRRKRAKSRPNWCSRKDTAGIYKIARAMEHITGRKYHVDHIYPVTGKNSCGLTVPANLRVIPAKINRRKANKILSNPDLAQARAAKHVVLTLDVGLSLGLIVIDESRAIELARQTLDRAASMGVLSVDAKVARELA